ncbi:class I SAM-dependent methyltransferase [Paralcaligenes ginsengisoli]
MVDVGDVRKFWNENPLWFGESRYESGSELFFEEHRATYIRDCFGGSFDLRFLPPARKHGQAMKILDLGCGVGFWTTEFAMRGLNNLVAADLTPRALEVTRQRLEIYGATAELKEENAEALSFSDSTFDHVNCQGVIHHTPDTSKTVAEISRVLKPGGTASISVYYRNMALRLWPWLRWAGYPLSWLGGGLKGRGREQIFLESNVDEIVRLYDGLDNPIGKSYSQKEFQMLLSPYFEIDEIYFHFFPARALPLAVPRKLHRWLDNHLPFMIYANIHKPCVA